ncbi:MAG: sigma-70 family RNA polymerase sigma factor [Actinomycetota bacterium]|nr:sigma-70 family RNA polymerase sigma factor [Actinomycetota bacterium]
MLAAAQENAGWALTQLYESLAPAVAGYLRAQGVRDAEDVASEVFLVVLSRVYSFAGTEAQFRSWVFTIAHRRIVDDRRMRARRPEVEALDAGALDDAEARYGTVPAEDEALRTLGTAWVEHVLSTLAPDQRAVLALRVLADLSVEDAADALEKQPGAIKALQRRAIAALRRTLGKEGLPRGLTP